jgi:hypothetical protein
MTPPSARCWFAVLALALPALGRAADVPADWAFQQPKRPAVPVFRTEYSVPRNPIDNFIFARLQKAGLKPSREADTRTLIRRVTFDLTGLPPTPEEVRAFLNDKSPDAYAKVVDRLLASPRFGERAALFWLDTVRYAESDGFKADDARPDAWRYRDYVIRSFNADKPFDRFIREQLAGDELFPGDADAVIATGFLRHYPYEYNAVNVEQKRQDILNDIADTTATAFLGLTLGCAKCHDHKFDPVTQEDYYRFQAFFAGYWPVERPLGTPEQIAAAERKQREWEAKTADLRRQIAALEKPARAAASAHERGRFPDEYAELLDIPAAKRTPLQKQLEAMVARQVYSRSKISASKIKPTADRKKWEELTKRLAATGRPPELPTAMAMTDVGTVAPPHHLLKRGNWQRPGAEMVPGFLSEIDDRDADVTPTATTTGRRAALAQWIASPDNPLTGRVAVNRVWQQMFGRGIVATPADFGATGERPTHPALLDWLACEFVVPAKPTHDRAWAFKRIYRLIALSSAYRQSSVADHGLKADPDNKLLWRMPRKRLDGEALRDAMLAVTGQLNLKAGGPGVYPELPSELKKSAGKWPVSSDAAERNHRSVYVAVKRNLRYPFFTLFDSPERTEVCARRYVTTTAPQALTLLNDQGVLSAARAFAARITKKAGTDPDAIIGEAFELALGRPPDTEERAAMRDFLDRHAGKRDEAIVDLCHSLLNLSEFLYVD